MGPLVRWEPISDLGRLREEMNRLIEDFFGETPARRGETVRIPSVDVVDRENELLVRSELPGIDKEHLHIEATPEALLIRGEMKKTEEHKGENYVRRERMEGVFQRVVPLPAEVKPDEVTARYTDGVLEVTLPKSDTAKGRKPVQVKIT